MLLRSLMVALAAVSLLVSCGGGDAPEPVGEAAADGNGRAQRLALPVGTPVNADAHLKGQFGPVKAWPVIPIHVALTADGRVLGYGSSLTGQQTANFNYAVWDAASDIYTTLSNSTGTDIFCSSQLLLPAGDQVFIAGGDNYVNGATNNTGNNNSNLFNATANTLTRTANMNRARWYSSSTMLLSGEILVQGGAGGSDRPEIRAADGSFRLLTGADTTPYNWFFPRNFAMPDGRLFGFDAEGRMYWLNPAGNGSISAAGTFPSATTGNDSTGAMFSPGRILQFGGNSNAAIVIDVTSGTPNVTSTASLAYQRRLGTATVMADGKVLASGGSIQWNVMNGVAYEAEIWNPSNGQWTRGATAQRARLYHSVALLLPDATVMVGGGGAPGPQVNLNHEIFYPPYLFKSDRTEAVRPTIAAAPTVVDPGRTVPVSVTHTRPVARVTFVKSGSVTHGWNMDQRFVDLPFNAQANGELRVQIPGRASDVPPGLWMMFVIDDTGVPSLAKMVRVNVAATLNTTVVPSITSPGNQSSTVGVAATAAVSASDPNGDPLTWSASGLPPGLAISAASGAISGTPTTAGTYSVTVAVTDGYNSANSTFTWTVASASGPLLLAAPTPLAPTVSGSTATFSASASGTNPRYSWNFGDGSPATPFSASGSATHNYAAPGVYYATVTVSDDSGATLSGTLMHQVFLAGTAQAPSISASIAYETRSGAPARLWVVNADNDSVSVFDTATRARLAEIAVGAAPRSLAIAPDGTVWVTNKQGASVSVISAATLAVTRTIALSRGSQPFGIAFARASGSALVALEGTGQLLKISSSSFNTTGTLAVGGNARHVTVAADGSTAYVTRFITPPLAGEGTATVDTGSGGGQMVVVDSTAMSIARTIVLAHSNLPDAENQGRGVPNYLGAAAISPDGTQAFVPSKMDNIARGTTRDGQVLNFQSTVRAISSRVVLGTQSEDLGARLDHDNASLASAAAFDPLGVYLFVALETSREVAVLDAHRRNPILRIDVGRAPQGLLVSPDRRTLYVHNFMDRSVSEIDLRALTLQAQASVTPVATLSSVGTERLAANVLQGKRLFYDARDTRLARDRYMSCASCHSDGGADGRVWDLRAQGEGLRNTISLRGRAGVNGGQGRLHWSNNFDEVQDFEGQIRSLAGGTGLLSDATFFAGTRSQPLGDAKAGLSAELDALAAYVGSLNTFDASPHRPSASALSAPASEGRQAFIANNCAACHSGSAFSRSGVDNPADVGTIKPTSGQRLYAVLTGIDVPTLRDVWATAPYLHDGSAATLEAAISAHTTLAVPAADVPRLAAYLREIGSDEVAAPAPGAAYTIWPATAAPAVASVSDTGAVNLGVKFTAEQSGFVSAIRFYKGAVNTGTHVGTLWSGSGQSLASVTFSNETASGWQQADLANPVAIVANATYVVSYHAPNGGYAVNYDYFAANGYDTPPLHALRDGVSGGNGVYVYGPTTQFPTSTYRTTNYWVDVVFTTGAVTDTTPPTVVTTSPTSGATNVDRSAAVTASFSEAVDAATVTVVTFELRDAANAVVAATVSYDGATRVATLRPTSALAASSVYTASVIGGASGVEDVAGNALAATRNWSFTTAAVDTTPPTVTATSPTSDATGIGRSANITATFSEAMDAATINTATFALRGPGNASIPAVVTWSATNRRATLNPNAALAALTTYTVTVRGGATDLRAKDVAGNALAADRVWSFTTR